MCRRREAPRAVKRPREGAGTASAAAGGKLHGRKNVPRTGNTAGGKHRGREAPRAAIRPREGAGTASAAATCRRDPPGWTPKSLCRRRREAPRAEKCAAGGKHRGRLNVQEKGRAQPLPPRAESSAGEKNVPRAKNVLLAENTAGGYTPKRRGGHSLCRRDPPPQPAGKDTEKPLPLCCGRGFFHTRKGAVRRGPSGGHRTAAPPCGAAYRPSRRLRRAPDAEASAAGVRSTFLQSFEVALNSASLRP